jgi:tetratricopeptide (TPR) repeat protein
MSEAQKLAQRAVDLDPNFTEGWHYLAWTYFDQAEQGRAKDRLAALGRARQLGDKLHQLDPEHAGAYTLRARLEMLPDQPEYDHEAALADARRSVELGPNDDNTHWTLGFVLYVFGHFDEATAEFAVILRLNPHPAIWQSGWHAVALSAAGHYEQAIAGIEAAVAAQPKNPLGPNFRGRVEGFAGHYADAAMWFERARELDPASGLYALFLVQVYDRLGRVDDAISLLEKGPP